tara:strand:+ start:668 stop:1735 length:1068 start_codon:yes stop_codon:yes gene_type:complete
MSDKGKGKKATSGKKPVKVNNGGGKPQAPSSSAKKAKKAPKKKEVESVDAGEDEEEYWARMEDEARHNEEESESSNGDSGSDSDDEIKLQDVVTHKSEEYTFEFNDMREGFTEGICTLLNTKFLANPTTAYDLAQVVTAQSIVGTAIVCEGAEDVFAFATVLPLKREEHLKSLYTALINPLITLLSEDKSKQMDKARRDDVLACLHGAARDKTGVLMHRRFANLPLELIGHLHRNLNEDLGWAQALDESVDGSGDGTSAGDHQDFKQMDSVLLLASCELTEQAKEGGGNKKILDVTGSSSSLLFDCFEDDTYLEQALACFYYRPGAHVNSGVAAMLLPVSCFKSCTNKIIKMIPS